MQYVVYSALNLHLLLLNISYLGITFRYIILKEEDICFHYRFSFLTTDSLVFYPYLMHYLSWHVFILFEIQMAPVLEEFTVQWGRQINSSTEIKVLLSVKEEGQGQCSGEFCPWRQDVDFSPFAMIQSPASWAQKSQHRLSLTRGLTLTR